MFRVQLYVGEEGKQSPNIIMFNCKGLIWMKYCSKKKMFPTPCACKITAILPSVLLSFPKCLNQYLILSVLITEKSQVPSRGLKSRIANRS